MNSYIKWIHTFVPFHLCFHTLDEFIHQTNSFIPTLPTEACGSSLSPSLLWYETDAPIENEEVYEYSEEDRGSSLSPSLLQYDTDAPIKNEEEHWPQLRRAPIKFGRFIKLNNINVKVLYKQADIFFLGGGRGRFAPKKGVTLLPRARDFQEKKSPQA